RGEAHQPRRDSTFRTEGEEQLAGRSSVGCPTVSDLGRAADKESAFHFVDYDYVGSDQNFQCGRLSRQCAQLDELVVCDRSQIRRRERKVAEIDKRGTER